MVTLIEFRTRDPCTCRPIKTHGEPGVVEEVELTEVTMSPLVWIAAATILLLIILSVPYVQRILFGKNPEESKLTMHK